MENEAIFGNIPLIGKHIHIYIYIYEKWLMGYIYIYIMEQWWNIGTNNETWKNSWDSMRFNGGFNDI